MPAEDGFTVVAFQDADASGIGLAKFEGGLRQFLKDGTRRLGHMTSQVDQGPILGRVVGRPCGTSSQLEGGIDVLKRATTSGYAWLAHKKILSATAPNCDRIDCFERDLIATAAEELGGFA